MLYVLTFEKYFVNALYHFIQCMLIIVPSLPSTPFGFILVVVQPTLCHFKPIDSNLFCLYALW